MAAAAAATRRGGAAAAARAALVVAQFELLSVAELRERLHSGSFTLDAGRIFSNFCAKGDELNPD